MSKNGVRIVDAAKYFVQGSEAIKVFDQDGRVLYHDRNHLTGTGASLVMDEIESAILGFLRIANRIER